MARDGDERDPQTYAILGAAMEVHRELGCGFLEPVYQGALEMELSERHIPFEREAPIQVFYKNHALKHPYRLDFLCYGEVIVEAKALPRLSRTEESQIIHYLKASRLHRGLLINFGTKSLEYKRFVYGE